MDHPAAAATTWVKVVAGFTLAVVLAGFVVIIVAQLVHHPETRRRLVVDTDPQGTASHWVRGTLTLDSGRDRIDFSLVLSVNVSFVQSIGIYGPRTLGQKDGPLFFALCGVFVGSPPATTAVCDYLTTPHLIEGELRELQPGGLATHNAIEELWDHSYPHYYVKVLPGDFQSQLK